MLQCKTFRVFTHVDNRDGDIGSGVSVNVSVFAQSEMGLTKNGPSEHEICTASHEMFGYTAISLFINPRFFLPTKNKLVLLYSLLR